MLAIHEPSGNVYFASQNSNEITVCNKLGHNRFAVISNSQLVKYPVGIALDSENECVGFQEISIITVLIFKQKKFKVILLLRVIV